MTQLSLTETDALVAKAARGAGLSWGMAEEAGFAARWLQAQGLPGATLLLGHLTQIDGAPWTSIAPQIGTAQWSGPNGTLSPLAAGVTLCDHASLLALPLTLRTTDCPAVLLPFLAALSNRLGTPVQMSTPNGQATLNGDEIWWSPLGAWLTTPATITLTQTTQPPTPPHRGTPVETSSQTLDALNTLALRTTVPPSAQSRASAGATGSDND